jgi:hypothetical protein
MLGPLGVSSHHDTSKPATAAAQAANTAIPCRMPLSTHKAGAIKQLNTKNKPRAGTAKLVTKANRP